MKTPRPSTLDNRARKLVHILYDKCVTCGKREDLQWAHLFGGYRNATRWNPFNYATQCATCNSNHNDNPRPYFRWFEREYGQDLLDRLEKLHATPGGVKLYAGDYRRISEALERCTRGAKLGMDGAERRRLFEDNYGVLV